MKQAENNRSEFAKRLRQLMDERDLTQRQVADAAGVTRASVIKWLKNSYPGSAELYRLSKALGVEMQWFFEVIPHNPDRDKMRTPVMETPVDAMSEDVRQIVKAGIEIYSSPEKRAYFEGWLKDSISQLTLKADSLTTSAMQPALPKLIARLKKATAERGTKVALAKYLGVHRQCVTDWLSGKQEPGGEITLRMLQWVEQRERQK